MLSRKNALNSNEVQIHFCYLTAGRGGESGQGELLSHQAAPSDGGPGTTRRGRQESGHWGPRRGKTDRRGGKASGELRGKEGTVVLVMTLLSYSPILTGSAFDYGNSKK